MKTPCYNYLQRKNSVTNTFDERLYDYINNWNAIINFYKENNLYDEYKLELEHCYVRYLYATFVKRAINYEDNFEYTKAVDETKKC